MSVVTFQADVFPYCKGDVVELDDVEKRRVDLQAKLRQIDNPYVGGNKRDKVVDVVDGHNQASVNRAAADRKATLANNTDQAAVLEAQRNAVAEPANVDALGLITETPAQVVTGTEPVADVEVSNPQQATDPSDPQGAEVKDSKSKK